MRHPRRRRATTWIATGAALLTALVIANESAGAKAPFIEIITAASLNLADLIRPPSDVPPGYVPPDLVTEREWPAQEATEPDPVRAGAKITFRTAYMQRTAVALGLATVRSTLCAGERSANPTSDHPAGRACDFIYAYPNPDAIAAGWRTANWLVANQAVLGVKYVIWQGQIWNASRRPGPWTVYQSSAYGCPNPANATGCHYDHVHVSMY